MKAQLDERELRIYCPTHKVTFEVVGASRIVCESNGEALARNFPYEAFWEYCSDCQTYWPANLGRSGKGREECLVCNRPVMRRYLCDQCWTLSLETKLPAKFKPFVFSQNGAPQPACPGCLSPNNSTLKRHLCADVEVEFITAHDICPFCDERIEGKLEAQTETLIQLCPDCSTAAKPTDRFCKHCGRLLEAQVRDHKEEAQQQIPKEEVLQRTSKAEVRQKTPGATPPPMPTIPSIKPLPDVASIKPATQVRQRVSVKKPGNGYYTSRDASVSSSIAPPPPLPVKTVTQNRATRLVIVVGCVVSAIVVAYFVAVMWRLQSQPDVKPEIKPAPPPLMAYVPGGEFVMGTDGGDEYERPQRKVRVESFYIDLYETTCEEYAKFVGATGHAPPKSWQDGRYPAGAARHPVTGVSWDDANAYAAWAGKRLPTEAEWEFAARGHDGRRYPWGNDWDPKAANAGKDKGSKAGIVDVGSYPLGKSPFGVFDLVGNAWEWTASDLEAYPGGKLPDKPVADMKVIRGNFWGSPPVRATTTFRRGWPARGDYDYQNTGFRCVKDIPPATAVRQ
jgi:formylglycine-generating enzyme required for sulfatase activity